MPPDASEQEPDFLHTRRKRLALASVIAALGMTALWAYRLRELAFGGDRYDSLRESMAAAHALVLFSFAVLFAGAACIRRKFRSWTTFFAVYTGVLVIESPALRSMQTDSEAVVQEFNLKRLASAKGPQIEREFNALRERERTIERDQQRLGAELKKTPPLSPEGLASLGSISGSDKRLADLIQTYDAYVEVSTAIMKLDGPQGAHDDDDLESLLAAELAAQREGFVAVRQELAYLRNTWGSWKYAPGASSIRYSNEAAQQEFERLAEVATGQETKMMRLADEVRAREATHSPPKL